MRQKSKAVSIIGIILIIVIILLTNTGCNKQVSDTTYIFDKAILKLPNGEIVKGKVEFWRDYEDGDQIQVKIDGKTYLVHSSNIVLINE